MRILSLSTSDLHGGASRAAYRLHQGLSNAGIDAQMLVQSKIGDESTVIGGNSKLSKALAIARPILDTLPLFLYPQRDKTPYIYSCQWLPSQIKSRLQALSPDLINLHWICGGFFPVEAIAKFNRPLVWTLHDMWGFTGGCHYSQQCDRYLDACGQCPMLKSKQDWDLSHLLWRRKAKALRDLNLTIVTPSKWLADCARASSLFKDLPIKVIPNGLNIEKYHPIERQQARQILGLPQDKQIILFGAIGATRDPRKGFELLKVALKQLSNLVSSVQVELVVFGSSPPTEPLDLGFTTHYLGYLHDDISLAIAYGAADVMVVPSTQEAFGQTASEALACGTPVVAFNTTGLKDIVDSQQNGYLAKAFDPDDLAQGIAWILSDQERWHRLSAQARAKVIKEFTVEIQTSRYLRLFEDILAKKNAN